MLLAVDVGYAVTKGMSETGQKACISSFVAPATVPSIPLGGSNLQYLPYEVTINGKTWYVGPRAEQTAAPITLRGQARKDWDVHDILLLTACALLGAGEDGPERVDVAVGLPLQFYANQRAALCNHIAHISAYVALQGQAAHYISSGRVHVFPQGAAVLAIAPNPPANGAVLVVDVGGWTTEYLLLEIRKCIPYPVPDACGSLELGTTHIQQHLAGAWAKETGTPLPQRMWEKVMARAAAGLPERFEGKEINLADALQTAQKAVGKAITAGIRTALGDRSRYVDAVYVCGGGSLACFDQIRQEWPTAVLLDDPEYANARGFLTLALS